MVHLPPQPPRSPPAYVPAVGPGLRKLLYLVLGLFSLLAINTVYLVSVTLTEWSSGTTIQNYFYQYMFLGHLALGLLMVPPLVVFGVIHIRNARNRPNRLAVRAGYGLFACALIVVGSGFLLLRIEGFNPLRTPAARDIVYWAHALSPLAVVWLFILHRLAGPRIHWRVGLALGGVGAAFVIAMVAFHAQDPRQWNVKGPQSGEQYFFPSLARTATGNFIPARTLMMDAYCQECHPDAHDGWANSVHRFSSFNNPAYLFSVRETRKALKKRDGTVQASRFCAGCHDPVPFFSGAFDEPFFDEPEFDPTAHPTATAGITCTSCHAITNINSVRGNSDYTIEEPTHYPFTFTENPALQWINRQLIKAKPAFHKRTFLKPLHKTAEFCGSCHKVHLPPELNDYKWLRGQNHYDSFLLSGVSGHGAQSFYYPPRAQTNCNGCHMGLLVSDDFGARPYDDSGELKVHNHMFPSANTAIPHLLGLPAAVNKAHEDFLQDIVRLDIFGIKESGAIDGKLTAPLNQQQPVLKPGETYLVEIVLRTTGLGHLFTQGTADSNQIWMDITARSDNVVLGRSGGTSPDGVVDPYSHFVNAYVLDRDGNRIDRRNPEDIFVALYNHQIPPGAADVIHYRLQVPATASGKITIDAKLAYRKFDTRYMRHIYGEDYRNDLPVTVMATDTMTLAVGTGSPALPKTSRDIPLWQRWNDYGIGLFRKGTKGARKGELRQAEGAFQQVEALGRADGPLNLARVYIKEGRLEEAVDALARAAQQDPPAAPWSVAWFSGVVNKQNGRLEEALQNFLSVWETRFTAARERGFDFSKDYRLAGEIGLTYFERAKRERGASRCENREQFLLEAARWFERALDLDPENVTAHYNLTLILAQLGHSERAAEHRALHARYKADDNARDIAVSKHRANNPAADRAAESIVIYDLQRPGAVGLPGEKNASGNDASFR
jgi:hypothetical protein